MCEELEDSVQERKPYKQRLLDKIARKEKELGALRQILDLIEGDPSREAHFEIVRGTYV